MTTRTYRQYGHRPSNVVVVHGGPGGAGEIEPLARELGQRGHAVLEPFQTRRSVEHQICELRSQIEQNCSAPVVLIGWSWGAWLGCLLASRYPTLIRTLILVGSGPFEARYAAKIKATKASRLTEQERDELSSLRPDPEDSVQVARFIQLNDIADTFQRDTSPQPHVEFDETIHSAVWSEAKALRASGALLDALNAVRCRVCAIHGDYDPRPAEGVSRPFRAALPSATFTLLKQCGHKPWQEIHAKQAFYQLLEQEIVRN